MLVLLAPFFLYSKKTMLPAHCLVSAYYIIPSKKTADFYLAAVARWWQNLSSSVPLVFFTDATTLQKLDDMFPIRTRPRTRIILQDYVELLHQGTHLDSSFWVRQVERDVEKYHTVELTQLWACKTFFVQKAATHVAADYYTWCDAGCIRDDESEEALRQFCTRSTGQLLSPDRLYLQSMKRVVVEERKSGDTEGVLCYAFPSDHIAGAIQMGSRQAWDAARTVYVETLATYDKAGVSASSDQYVLRTCTDTHPHLFKILYSSAISKVDTWFHMLVLF
jgi:hypothetical protein